MIKSKTCIHPLDQICQVRSEEVILLTTYIIFNVSDNHILNKDKTFLYLC